MPTASRGFEVSDGDHSSRLAGSGSETSEIRRPGIEYRTCSNEIDNWLDCPINQHHLARDEVVNANEVPPAQELGYRGHDFILVPGGFNKADGNSIIRRNRYVQSMFLGLRTLRECEVEPSIPNSNLGESRKSSLVDVRQVSSADDSTDDVSNAVCTSKFFLKRARSLDTAFVSLPPIGNMASNGRRQLSNDIGSIGSNDPCFQSFYSLPSRANDEVDDTASQQWSAFMTADSISTVDNLSDSGAAHYDVTGRRRELVAKQDFQVPSNVLYDSVFRELGQTCAESLDRNRVGNNGVQLGEELFSNSGNDSLEKRSSCLSSEQYFDDGALEVAELGVSPSLKEHLGTDHPKVSSPGLTVLKDASLTSGMQQVDKAVLQSKSQKSELPKVESIMSQGQPESDNISQQIRQPLDTWAEKKEREVFQFYTREMQASDERNTDAAIRSFYLRLLDELPLGCEIRRGFPAPLLRRYVAPLDWRRDRFKSLCQILETTVDLSLANRLLCSYEREAGEAPCNSQWGHIATDLNHLFQLDQQNISQSGILLTPLSYVTEDVINCSAKTIIYKARVVVGPFLPAGFDGETNCRPLDPDAGGNTSRKLSSPLTIQSRQLSKGNQPVERQANSYRVFGSIMSRLARNPSQAGTNRKKEVSLTEPEKVAEQRSIGLQGSQQTAPCNTGDSSNVHEETIDFSQSSEQGATSSVDVAELIAEQSQQLSALGMQVEARDSFRRAVTSTPVALKISHSTDDIVSSEMANEVAVLSLLNHPNIAKLIEAFWMAPSYTVLVEEFLIGSLKRLSTDFGPLPESFIAAVAGDLLTALRDLHSGHVLASSSQSGTNNQGNEANEPVTVYGVPSCLIHNDIKTENILLDANCVAKLADFSSATFVPNGCKVFKPAKVAGSACWMAPECFLKARVTTHHSEVARTSVFPGFTNNNFTLYDTTNNSGQTAPMAVEHEVSPASDIWGLGLCLYELAAGELPQELIEREKHGKSKVDFLKFIAEEFAPTLEDGLYPSGRILTQQHSDVTNPSFVEVSYSKELRNFLALFFIRDPAERPTAETLLKHPFLISNMKNRPPSYKALFSLLLRRQPKSLHTSRPPKYSPEENATSTVESIHPAVATEGAKATWPEQLEEITSKLQDISEDPRNEETAAYGPSGYFQRLWRTRESPVEAAETRRSIESSCAKNTVKMFPRGDACKEDTRSLSLNPLAFLLSKFSAGNRSGTFSRVLPSPEKEDQGNKICERLPETVLGRPISGSQVCENREKRRFPLQRRRRSLSATSSLQQTSTVANILRRPHFLRQQKGKATVTTSTDLGQDAVAAESITDENIGAGPEAGANSQQRVLADMQKERIETGLMPPTTPSHGRTLSDATWVPGQNATRCSVRSLLPQRSKSCASGSRRSNDMLVDLSFECRLSQSLSQHTLPAKKQRESI